MHVASNRRRTVAGPRLSFRRSADLRHRDRARRAVLDQSDARTLEELQEAFGRLPPEVFAQPELIETMLPTLRADFALLEGFPTLPALPLPWPVVSAGGPQGADRVLAVVRREFPAVAGPRSIGGAA